MSLRKGNIELMYLADNKLIRQDGRFYVLDFARTFPPEAVLQDSLYVTLIIVRAFLMIFIEPKRVRFCSSYFVLS